MNLTFPEMYFLSRCFKRFYASDVKAPSISSYLKDNAQTILTAATILTGVFAAGVFSAQSTASRKVLEERIKATEEKARGEVMVLEEKSKGQVMVLDERIKTADERIKTTDERIKTAKEEAKKEALERLFNIINQSEYASSKKAINEIQIQKENVK